MSRSSISAAIRGLTPKVHETKINPFVSQTETLADEISSGAKLPPRPENRYIEPLDMGMVQQRFQGAATQAVATPDPKIESNPITKSESMDSMDPAVVEAIRVEDRAKESAKELFNRVLGASKAPAAPAESTETGDPKPPVSGQDTGAVVSDPGVTVAETEEEGAAAPPAATESEEADPPTPPLTEQVGYRPEDLASPKGQSPKATPRPLPMPDEAPVNLLRKSFNKALSIQKKLANNAFGRFVGSAVSAVMTGDPSVSPGEVSVSARLLLKAYNKPSSILRTLMADSVDHSLMIKDDAYALNAIVGFFRDNDVEGICEKSPVTAESDAHVRVIRAHLVGNGVKVHPAVHAIWNADFDGDEMKVSFAPNNRDSKDPFKVFGMKRAMSFLVGTDGKNKLDSGFFVISQWDSSEKTTQDMLEQIFGPGSPDPKSFTRAELNGMADAINEAHYGDADAGLRSLMRWIVEAGFRIGGNEGGEKESADILARIWNANTLLIKVSVPLNEMSDYTGPLLENIDRSARELADKGIIERWKHSLVDGENPSSLYSYARAVGAAFGFVAGRNVAFRFYAGLMKLSKADSAFDSPRSSAEIITAESLITQQAAGLVDLEDKGRGIAQNARDMIAIEAGRPDFSSPQNFMKWIDKFTYSYNTIALAVNTAVESYALDSTPAGSGPKLLPEIDTSNKIEMQNDIRSAFLKIYGRYTVRSIFGELDILAGWEDATVQEFVRNNHFTDEQLGKSTDIWSAKDKSLIKRFIGRVADLRTSFARKFHNELFGDKDGKGGLLTEFMAPGGGTVFKQWEKRYLESQSTPYKYALEDDLSMLAYALFVFSPDLFYFVGLHNPSRFFESTLGRRFVDAQNINELGGAMYEAIARFRYEPIRLARVAVKEAREAGDTDAEAKALMRIEHELDKLASSSEVWQAVVAEYRMGEINPFTKILFATKDDSAVAFGRRAKDKAITTLVQKHHIRSNIYDYEISYGLFAMPKGEFSGTRFTGDLGHTRLLDGIRESKGKISAFAKTDLDSIIEHVNEAADEHMEQEGNLVNFVSQVAQDPTVLTRISRYSFVDASIDMIKSFASSEKAKQEQISSFMYQAVGLMKNGGTFSDAAYGGDLALGKISSAQFLSSPVLVAKVLTDPSFSIEVYDGAHITTVSMAEIFGTDNPSEEDMWDWLKKHPRAAMALRQHSVRSSINKKTGFSYTVATSNLKDSISSVIAGRNEIDDALALLADHPGLYAILAMTTAITGKKRAQVRRDRLNVLEEAMEMLMGISDWQGNMYELVRQVAMTNGLDVAAIERDYNAGMELDPKGTVGGLTKAEYVDRIITLRKADKTGGEEYKRLVSAAGDISQAKQLEDGSGFDPAWVFDSVLKKRLSLADAPINDIRFFGNYQMGQLMHDLAGRLDKYSSKLTEAGLVGESYSVDEVATLLRFDDAETRYGYFDTIQKMSGAKSSQSTSVNGAVSKLLAGVMILAHLKGDPCDAPVPESIPIDEFLLNWREHEGRQVRLGDDDWIPVSENTLHHIQRLSPTEVVVEIPSQCTSHLCACKRHATADPSTHRNRNTGTTAIGRFLTNVRSLSTEGLNLKTKTLGDDGTDSITKLDVFSVMGLDTVGQVKDAFIKFDGDELGKMSAARVTLAKAMKSVYSSIGYNEEITLDDFTNIAQLLVRPVLDVGTGDVIDVDVLSLGQVSELINAEMIRHDEDLDWEGFIDAAETALRTYATNRKLSVESLMSRVKVASTHFFRNSSILDSTTSAANRNFDVLSQIQKIERVKQKSPKELAEIEKKILEGKPDVGVLWHEVLEIDVEKTFPYQLYTHRLVGVFRDDYKVMTPAIGPSNSVVINTNYSKFVDEMRVAYNRGLNILLEGEPTTEQWIEVGVATNGALQPDQGIDYGKVLGVQRTFISTFDIRLNGKASIFKGGAFNAGVFWAKASQVAFIIESALNEFGLSDSEMAACKSFIKGLVANHSGEYSINPSVAMAQTMVDMSDAGSSTLALQNKPQSMSVVSEADLKAIVLADDFDLFDDVDTGITLEEGTDAHTRLVEGLERFKYRYENEGLDENTGLLRTGRPDEIVGWLVAEWDGEDDVIRKYHPVRLFEVGNNSAAPEEFTITEVVYRSADSWDPADPKSGTGLIDIKWKQSYSMEGRTFKIFEDLYSANKFIARIEALDDIVMRNGMLVSGVIAKASTASRRLFMRRQQLLTSLMYVSRMDPHGYNMAEDPTVLADNTVLRNGLLYNNTDIGDWVEALEKTDEDGNPIDLMFFSDDLELNKFANKTARDAIKYGINPNVVFASKYKFEPIEGEPIDERWIPSNLWFNFQVLFADDPNYQDHLMKLMSRMSPGLCPESTTDTRGGTLFNNNLQIEVPISYKDTDGNVVTKYVWVDMFAGFHFLDEHYGGRRDSGATVKTGNLATLNTLLAAKKLSRDEIAKYRQWGNMIDIDPDYYGPMITQGTMSEMADDPDEDYDPNDSED